MMTEREWFFAYTALACLCAALGVYFSFASMPVSLVICAALCGWCLASAEFHYKRWKKQ